MNSLNELYVKTNLFSPKTSKTIKAIFCVGIINSLFKTLFVKLNAMILVNRL